MHQLRDMLAPNGIYFGKVNICSPAVIEGSYAISARRGPSNSPTIGQLKEWGVFNRTKASEKVVARSVVSEALEMKRSEKWCELIEHAFLHGFNVVFAGSVNTGKTTNLRAFLNELPLDRRLFTVADFHELLHMPHLDIVHTLYDKNGKGISKHTAEECIEAALRCDMDELVNAEVRDRAAWALVRAHLSGTPIKTSCHAKSAVGALESLAMMAKQHPVGQGMGTDDIRQTMHAMVDMVVFSEVCDSCRQVTDIYYQPERPVMPAAVTNAVIYGG